MNGKIIKELRIRAGLTQDELAEKLGYSGRSTISKIESDVFELGQDKVVRCADILGVSPLVILGLETEEESNRRVVIEDIVEKMELLSDEGIKQVEDLVNLIFKYEKGEDYEMDL